MALTIDTTTPQHVRLLAPRLRAEDLCELVAAGITAEKALWRSYRQASWARTAFVDGEIAAIWGVGGCPLGTLGRPWLLTSPAAERVKTAFLREGRQEVAEMLAIFQELRGYVDARYSRAVRLLDMLGFTLSSQFPFGPHGAPFRRYTLRRT